LDAAQVAHQRNSSLGPLGELNMWIAKSTHLDRAVTSEADSFSQEFRLALIRSLLWLTRHLRQTDSAIRNNVQERRRIKLFAKLLHSAIALCVQFS